MRLEYHIRYVFISPSVSIFLFLSSGPFWHWDATLPRSMFTLRTIWRKWNFQKSKTCCYTFILNNNFPACGIYHLFEATQILWCYAFIFILWCRLVISSSYMMSNGYKPAPLDLSDVKLTAGQEVLVDKLAENAHNVWAKDRIKQGWTYGIQQVKVFWI